MPPQKRKGASKAAAAAPAAPAAAAGRKRRTRRTADDDEELVLGGGGGGAGGGGGRTSAFDIADDDENGGGRRQTNDVDDEEHEEETAEERRLRIAKAYIEAMRVRSSSGGAGTAADDLEAALGDRLREEAYASAGYKTRNVADSIVIPSPPATARKEATTAVGAIVEESEESEEEEDEEEEEEEEERFEKRRTIRSSSGTKASSSSSTKQQNPPRNFPEGYTLGRAHGATVTAVALSSDCASAFSVSKDGSLIKIDVETGKKAALAASAARARPPAAPSTHEAAARVGKSLHAVNPTAAAREAAPWAAGRRSGSAGVFGGTGGRQRRGGKNGGGGGATPPLLAVAASDCGRWVAAAGADGRVHAFDAKTLEHVRSHAGHIGAVTSLAFAPGKGTNDGPSPSSSSSSSSCGDLYSGGADGTVRIWSLDDGAYVDSLFGHQAAVLSLTVTRGGGGRPVSGGADRTCRLWKVAEETQLIFRAPGQSADAVCSVGGGGGEWCSGGADGALCLWSPLKKRPAAKVAGAHFPGSAHSSSSSRRFDPVRGWIGAVAASRGGDLVASGAGDGSVRLWAARGVGGGGSGSGSGTGGGGSSRSLEPLGTVPAPGFVNGLALSQDARVLVAAVGPEPRLGRWSKAPSARPAIVVQRLRHRGDE